MLLFVLEHWGLFVLGLFGKAKKKILGEKENHDYVDQSDSVTDTYSANLTKTGYDSSLWDPQEIGLENWRIVAFVSDIFHIKNRRWGLNSNETTLQQSSNKVDVIKCRMEAVISNLTALNNKKNCI